LSNEMSESESKSETSVVACWWVWRRDKTYTFIRNPGPQFNLLADEESMDYFILFFNDEMWNSIVIKTNRYTRHKNCRISAKPVVHLT
jgi:hypothetical protein